MDRCAHREDNRSLLLDTGAFPQPDLGTCPSSCQEDALCGRAEGAGVVSLDLSLTKPPVKMMLFPWTHEGMVISFRITSHTRCYRKTVNAHSLLYLALQLNAFIRPRFVFVSELDRSSSREICWQLQRMAVVYVCCDSKRWLLVQNKLE